MKRRELEHQIQDLLDGNLDESQLDALQYELRTNSEAREIYRDFIHLQNAMQMNATVPAAVGKALIPIDRVVRRQRVKALRLTALASAAVLLVGLVTLALLTVRVKPSEQAVFRVAPGTQYSVSHTKQALEGGMQLEVGSRLQLQQGTVELLFGNGVKSVVMAPADMILLKGNHLQLNKGRAWFEVSQGAEGFTVLTKELKVVDLGTQFGVLADHVKYDEVHVFKGKVQVETLKEGAEAEIIKAGEARKLKAMNTLLAVDVEPEKFIETLPDSLPYLHWSFDHAEGNAYPAEGSMPGVELAAASPRIARVEDNKVPGKYGAGVTFRKFENELTTKHPGIGGDRPRTVACWIKVKKAPRGRTMRTNIVGWGDRDVMLYNRQRWQLAVMGDGEGASNLTVVGAGAHRTNSKLENGEWYHVAAVWDPGAKPPETGVMRVYINGQEQKLGVYQKDVWPNTKVGQEALPIVIGATMTLKNNNRSTFHGAIDELFIIEGAIGQDQVIQLMEKNSMK